MARGFPHPASPRIWRLTGSLRSFDTGYGLAGYSPMNRFIYRLVRDYDPPNPRTVNWALESGEPPAPFFPRRTFDPWSRISTWLTGEEA
ncbi:hypothetical protein SAMN05444581_11575 [Methylocapsa palsarum]|uniref:Uncharacterized protein n=1 Tax=Methylocapsa palsarum TaxID=1612308 RepID=A0A1I4BNA0_9HYPH|nr:hypothetical protein SAMN05444581_11575 [Methylocapsa palsarum]